MAKILVSIAAAQANLFIKYNKPSDIIPFKGKFPLLENYKIEDYNKIIFNTQFVEDCPDWVQDILLKGQRMYLIDSNFRNYLKDNGISIDEFHKKSNSDKADELIRFLNANSLSISSLKIN